VVRRGLRGGPRRITIRVGRSGTVIAEFLPRGSAPPCAAENGEPAVYDHCAALINVYSPKPGPYRTPNATLDTLG